MTVNTNALVPAGPKSGKAADGPSGDRGQASAKEAAAAFHSVMQGMKRGEASVDGAGGDGRNPEPSDDGAETTGENTAGKPAESTGRPADRAAFSTSNLVDALRQVSHNVLARVSGAEAADEAAAQKAPGQGEGAPGADRPVAHAALSLEAVLVPKPGSLTKGAPPDRTASPQPFQALVPDRIEQGVTGKDGAAKTGTSSLFAQFGVEPEAAGEAGAGVGRRSLLPEEAAGTVKILRQETHFAPNLRLSPAQQVGDQIATALKTLSADPAPAQAGVTHKAEGPVLKTLDIQLTPHELGTVKVSLRMVGDTVEVSLKTSNPQTAELLKQDRQLLDQMLRTTGFKADTITIQAADDRGSVQAGSSANGNSAMNQNNSGGGATGEGQSQNAGGGSSGQQQGRPGERTQDEHYQVSEQARGTGHEEATGNSLSDGIYL